MLVMQSLVFTRAARVSLRIAPSPNQSVFRCGLVDDPQLVECGDAEQNVPQCGIVVNAVHVQPIRRGGAGGTEIDVHPVGG